MSRDQETDRKKPAGASPEEAQADLAIARSTTFSSTGELPPVETVKTTAGPTASELAYGPEKGPGMKALEELLAAGAPNPKQVVALIDAHRAEHDALLAHVEQKLGAAFVAEVHEAMGLRASIKRREIVSGDPGDPGRDYFIASEKDKGARWRAGDGRFTGKADQKGLDTTYQLDEDDALHGQYSKDKTATLAWEHDGKSQGELYGKYKGGDQYEAGVRRHWELGDGQLTTGLRHKVQEGEATQEVFTGYRTADGRFAGEVGLGMHEGHFSQSGTLTAKPTDKDTITGSIVNDDRGVTGALGGVHRWDGGQADAGITRGLDRTTYHLGGSQQLAPPLGLSGRFDHVDPDHGQGQTVLGLSERYRTPRLVQSFDLEAGKGEKDYFQSTGSLEAGLGSGLYGGTWGMYRVEDGHQQTAQLGASLTFTPSEKTALTLAGVLDQNGALEARLQLDVFKARIKSVADLSDRKKDALISLFVSYSTDGDRHMLDDRFGKGQLGTPEGDQLRAGIRIKF